MRVSSLTDRSHESCGARGGIAGLLARAGAPLALGGMASAALAGEWR